MEMQTEISAEGPVQLRASLTEAINDILKKSTTPVNFPNLKTDVLKNFVNNDVEYKARLELEFDLAINGLVKQGAVREVDMDLGHAYELNPTYK